MNTIEKLLSIKQYIPKEQSAYIDDAIECIKTQDVKLHQLRNELSKWYLGQKQPVRKMDKAYYADQYKSYYNTHE